MPPEHTRIVPVSGEVTFSNVNGLGRELERALETARNLVVDLTDVTFIDSSGLSVIADAHRRRARSGHRLTIRGLTPSTFQTFELTGLHRELDIESPPGPEERNPDPGSS